MAELVISICCRCDLLLAEAKDPAPCPLAYRNVSIVICYSFQCLSQPVAKAIRMQKLLL